jgi:hypothetical protein
MTSQYDYYARVYRDVSLLGQEFVNARLQTEALYPAADKNKDVRITAFGRCANVCVSTSLGMGLFGQYILNDEWWQAQVTTQMPPEVIASIRIEFQQFQKLGFIHFSYVAIESALRALNKVIDPKFIDQNFKNIYDNLLKKLRLRRYRCLLDLLRLLRNTLHTNGYHNAKDEIITYKGKIYRFVEGQMPQYFEWSFLAGLLYDVKDMLFDIVKSRQLSDYTQIDDPFITV